MLRGDLLLTSLLLLLLLLLDVGLQVVHGVGADLSSGLGVTNDHGGADRR